MAGDPPLFRTYSVTDEEKAFVAYYLATGNKSASFRHAWPRVNKRETGQDFDKHDYLARANEVLKRLHVQAYMELARAPAEEFAKTVLHEQLFLGKASEQRSAAIKLLDEKGRDKTRDVFARWRELVIESGAEIVMPVPPNARDVRITAEDFLSGKAFLEFGPAARVKLLHLAGAPWNEDDPEARLSEIQEEILYREERTLIVHGGSGLGKSTLGGAVCLPFLLTPGTNGAIIADTYDHCADEFQYTYKGILRLFGLSGPVRLSNINSPTHHDMEVQMPWGARLRTFSIERKEGAAVLGKQLDYAVIGEAAHMPAEVGQRKVRRALDRAMKVRSGTGYIRRTGYCFMFTTPDWEAGYSGAEWDRVVKLTKNRPEEMHAGRVPWAESVYIREVDVLENPAYSREAYEAARASLPPEVFAEQYQGRKQSRTGLVFKEFREDTHVVPMPPPEKIREMRLSLGVDTGKHFAATLCGLDRQGVLWVLGEVYESEQKIADNTRDVIDMIDGVLSPAWNLTGEKVSDRFELLRDRIEMWYVDNATQHLEDLDDQLGATFLRAETGHRGSPQLFPTIDFVRKLQQQMKFLIAETCDWLIWEFNNYKWRHVPTKGPGGGRAQLRPQEKDDHAIDTIRFQAKPLVEAGPLESPPPPVSFEEAYDKQLRHELYGHLTERARQEAAARRISFHG